MSIRACTYTYSYTCSCSCLLLAVLLWTSATVSHGFVPWLPTPAPSAFLTLSTRLQMALPEIGDMRMGEIRNELESYGISTKSFLEKKEMVEALEQARNEGKSSNANSSTTSSNNSNSSNNNNNNSNSNNNNNNNNKEEKSRGEKIKEEMSKANESNVKELRTKLQAMGISTKSFFEKSEFVKAYAEAVVDGVSATGTNGSTSASVKEEPFDSSYRDVVMQKFDPRMLRESVIDVRLGR